VPFHLSSPAAHYVIRCSAKPIGFWEKLSHGVHISMLYRRPRIIVHTFMLSQMMLIFDVEMKLKPIAAKLSKQPD
jgi:hypothetical protein